MLEFIEVDQPMVWPNACGGCMGIKGPFIDTHRELPGYGRLYVCQGCVRRAAVVLGLVKGKRMDELAEASELLYQARLDAAGREERVTELLGLLEQERADKAKALEDVEFNAGRVKQLEDRLAQQARAALELVGAADA